MFEPSQLVGLIELMLLYGIFRGVIRNGAPKKLPRPPHDSEHEHDPPPK